MGSVPDLREIGDATSSLRASVDTVCEAIMFVFAKITEVTETANRSIQEQRTIVNGIKWIGAIQLVMVMFIGLATWRVERSVVSTQHIQRQQVEATKDIKRLAKELNDLKSQTIETRKSVDEVKKKAEEAPRVEIVPDSKKPGSAVVRIVPSISSADPDESAPPAPTESAVSVEIPIRNEARPAKSPRQDR
jgi:hypothetical protein